MKKNVLKLSFVYICVLACIFGQNMFNRYVLMSLPLYSRLLLMPLVYWCIALVPVIITVYKKCRMTDLGFSTHHILYQVFTGIVIAMIMSGLFTLLPHLMGFGDMVDSGSRYKYLWQYLYSFFYHIIGIGAVEEFVFRGYFYNSFKNICSKEWVAVLVSSILFGFSHIFTGNIIQVFMTMLLGILFCVLMLKVKNCTLLSLIISHGIYDALISVWSSLLLK